MATIVTIKIINFTMKITREKEKEIEKECLWGGKVRQSFQLVKIKKKKRLITID